ncbi:AT-rich interactive domain-containing protein 2 [Phtheirospermum japonicum]|uniref:AT-rich interactive domain-containing protein 2 n=1 Tax=Phtheirospermum japonicum TaxID=374723 RepID=A0A830B0M9_9LAMI|nr:AT-rich interactive domain-containing protein 2 [Phtheirospermum japonicum]
MKLSTPNIKSNGRPKPKDRFTFITNECVKLIIPIGPRFQADVPSWTRPTIGGIELDNSKWICIPTWPAKGLSQDTNNNTIGRGRSDFCECAFRGSIECVAKHVSEKRTQLRVDLGPAFWRWKFDVMGEGVSRLWSRDEEKRFDCVVKANPTSQGRSFVKCALECFPCQSRASIVSYYLNVYIPRRIRDKTRSNCTAVIDSDDDDDDDNEDVPPIKGSRKRCQANSLASGSPTKYIKTKYLTTRR